MKVWNVRVRSQVGTDRGSVPRRVAALTARGLLVAGVAVGGLWVATHGIAGVAVADVVAVLRGVAVRQLCLLAVIWLGGLGIYATVLSAALPGLGVRRGLLLNLSGSAVANVVPLGGAAATALNWRMVRAWGHSTPAFTTFCVLTNALDVATKLALPAVAVATATAVSMHVPVGLWAVAAGCTAALGLAVAVTTSLMRHPARGDDEDDVVPARWELVLAVRRLATALRGTVVRVGRALAADWPRLVPASAAYVAAQVLLLDVSLHAVGLAVTVPVVLMAAAIERLGTILPVTPGGTGVAEIGTVAWLVASGGSPALVVGGVLLYRLFLIGMEVPLGGLLLGAWAWWTWPGRVARVGS
jgi:uncharacterized membrane protein YbhN (UPF0104 family)